MGTDLFTSHRGAGVIGTLLALIVLAGFWLLAVLVFDDRFQGDTSVQAAIQQQDKEIERLHKQIAGNERSLAEVAGRTQIAEACKTAERSASVAALSLQRIRDDVEAARKEIADLDAEALDYRQKYRVATRAAAKGETLAELKLLSGKVYKDVTVREIDAIRMQIRHAEGFTGVPVEDLPLDWQDRLQVSMEEKEAALETEGDTDEIRHLLADIAEIRTGINRVESHIAGLRKKVTELETNMANVGPAQQNIQSMLLQERQNLSADQAKARSGRGVSDAPQIEARIRQLEGRLRALRQVEPNARKEISKIDDEIRGLQPDLDSRKASLGTKLELLEAKRAEVKAKQEEEAEAP